jgi:alkylation response protein AidB-like acyl-CoA dehydrogenase
LTAGRLGTDGRNNIGNFADYFSTAVRTGGPGMGGISLLLIPRGEGVTTKIIKTSYSSSAGTAYVFFEVRQSQRAWGRSQSVGARRSF